ncbi:hypothetical protein SAMN05421827_109120 [Pedobacter terrae]|uniref:Uncharacterized protein n=1 Tax=Pedobacter terrae TaxID=405671 RepID=A0A1G7W6K3_9SPHI|nr:hypothetical protein [Pedobacter terrae]SDG67546.1 hypothetical protein SAMN05421827_109120 [Pedobacter terrae]
MERFSFIHSSDEIIVTSKNSGNTLFMLTVNNQFMGYVAKHNGEFVMQPGSKLSIDLYHEIVSGIKIGLEESK